VFENRLLEKIFETEREEMPQERENYITKLFIYLVIAKYYDDQIKDD
jgi:hypothetical protein